MLVDIDIDVDVVVAQQACCHFVTLSGRIHTCTCGYTVNVTHAND